MRTHVRLDDAVVTEIDAISSPRHHSAFVREAICDALDETTLVFMDTTVLVDCLSGDPTVGRVNLLPAHRDRLCTSINLDEVIRGLRAPEDVAVPQLFTGLRVVATRRAEGRRAGVGRASDAPRDP